MVLAALKGGCCGRPLSDLTRLFPALAPKLLACDLGHTIFK